MKKVLSILMCIVLVASTFSILNVTTLAANAKDLMTVSVSAFKDNKVTYTIKLKSKIKFTGVVNHIYYDENVLAPVSASVCGDYAGFDVNGLVDGKDGAYTIATVNGSGAVWNSSEDGTDLMKITFKLIDSSVTSTSVKFYCVEFNSPDSAKNIKHDKENPSPIATVSSSTLSVIRMKSAVTDNGGIKITWYKTTGADWYRVYKKVSGSWKSIKDVPGTTTSYIDKSVAHNAVGEYTVRAFDKNDVRDSGIGNSVKARYIMAPATFKGSLVTNGVKVAWTGVSGATTYRIYRRILKTDGTATEWTLIYKAGAKVRNYTDKTVKSGNRYQYVIRSVTANGTSGSHRNVSVWYYAAPSFTVASAKGGVQVKWSKVAGATSYKIYRKYSESGSWTTVATVSGGTTSYLDKPSVTVKKVYYTVRAFAANGSSKFTTKSFTYVKTPTLKTPTNAKAGIKVSWSSIKSADGYYVYRKAGNATSWTKLGKVKSTSYTDKKVKKGTKYTYTVKATYKTATSGYDKTGVKITRK